MIMDKVINITVDIEEWFHTEWFNVEKVINKYYDGKYPKTDVEDCTKKLIELFNRNNVKATFFVLGETAERYPSLISLNKQNKHEIACHGYYHNKYNSVEFFRKDIKIFKKNIYADIKGFRFPYFYFSEEKLGVLADENFQYDSSVVPCRRIPGYYGRSDLSIKPFEYQLSKNSIKEFPVAVSPWLRLPGGGGWFFRNVGYRWTQRIVKSSLKKVGYANIYIHPWEFSENNPVFKEIPFHVYRRTGEYCLKGLEKFILYFSDNGSSKFLDIGSSLIEEN